MPEIAASTEAITKTRTTVRRNVDAEQRSRFAIEGDGINGPPLRGAEQEDIEADRPRRNAATITSSSSTKTPTPMNCTTLSREAENSGGEYCADLPHTSVATFCMISATPMVVSTQEYCPPDQRSQPVEWPQGKALQPPTHERQHGDHGRRPGVTGTPASSKVMLR